jgi:hypothetical protein
MIELVAASIIIKPDRLLWRCWAVTASILLVLPLSATAVGLVHPGKSMFIVCPFSLPHRETRPDPSPLLFN